MKFIIIKCLDSRKHSGRCKKVETRLIWTCVILFLQPKGWVLFGPEFGRSFLNRLSCNDRNVKFFNIGRKSQSVVNPPSHATFGHSVNEGQCHARRQFYKAIWAPESIK